jgi:epoxide hydrolase
LGTSIWRPSKVKSGQQFDAGMVLVVIAKGSSDQRTRIDSAHVLGLHVVTDPFTAANVATFLPRMADSLDQRDPVDKVIQDRMAESRVDGSGYLAIQNTRPQTIGYGLVDSPVRQLAWIAEKFEAWTDLPIDRDQLLTTISLYWFTGSGATAAQTLYEQAHSSDWGHHPRCPQASRSSARTRPCAGWFRLRPARTGASSSTAGTSRPWRPPWRSADLQTFFGPLS